MCIYIYISFSWMEDLHQSFFFTSSACCVLSVAIMSSMAFFTLVMFRLCPIVEYMCVYIYIYI